MHTDEDGDCWLPLPENSRYCRTEGAFLVDGVPVFTMMVNGELHYLVN